MIAIFCITVEINVNLHVYTLNKLHFSPAQMNLKKIRTPRNLEVVKPDKILKVKVIV